MRPRRRPLLAVVTVVALAPAVACFISIPNVTLEKEADAAGGGNGGAGSDAGDSLDGAAQGRDASDASDASSGSDAGADVGPCTLDLQADPRHCGRCGHDCQGGACTGGVCQPFALLPALSGPFKLAVDATHVFWTDWTSNGVFRAEKDHVGGATTIAIGSTQGAASPWAIAVDDTHVFWSNALDTGGSIYRCPKTGCGTTGAQRVATGLAEPTEIAIDGERLYFVERGARVIRYVTKTATDGAPTLVVDGLGAPAEILIDDQRIFWCDEDGPKSHVAYAPKAGIPSGTAPSFVATSQQRPFGITQAGTQLYWANSGPPYFNSTGSIEGRAKPGTDGGTLTQPGTQPYFISASGGDLFWSDRGPAIIDSNTFTVYPNGSVRACKLPACAGGVRVVAAQQPAIQEIVATPDAVYWANSGVASAAGSIMKVVRDVP